MRHIDNAERRARLALRHGIHPAHHTCDALAATGARSVPRATDAFSVRLAMHARTDRVGPGRDL